jgi:hypothetical protein
VISGIAFVRIGMAIRADRTCFREVEFGVAAAAGNLLMCTDKHESGLRMPEQ